MSAKVYSSTLIAQSDVASLAARKVKVASENRSLEIMKRVLLSVLACTGLAAAAAHSVSGDAFHWPDSSQYSRVIVNATQGIETRPREWFAKDKLVTDFAVVNLEAIGQGKAEKDYQAIRQLLGSYGLTVGTYVSGTSVVPEARETQWPWPRVPIEWMPSGSHYNGTWPNTPYRKMIDVTDPATRHALQDGLKRLWQQHPAPVRFVDNAAAHHALGGPQPWSGYCANMEEIRKLGESMGSLQIFNIALHVEDLSDEETRQLVRRSDRAELRWRCRGPRTSAITQARRNAQSSAIGNCSIPAWESSWFLPAQRRRRSSWTGCGPGESLQTTFISMERSSRRRIQSYSVRVVRRSDRAAAL